MKLDYGFADLVVFAFERAIIRSSERFGQDAELSHQKSNPKGYR
jgi:hypothetical protein